MARAIVVGNCLNNTRGILRSLYKAGIKATLILESPHFKALKYSKYVSKCHIAQNPKEAVDLMLQLYGNEPQRSVVFCSSDPAICEIDKRYDELKKGFVTFNAGSQDRINQLMNKDVTFPIAEKYGFEIINTIKVTGGQTIPANITFPCLIKGNNSTSSTKLDMCVCDNRKELEKRLHTGVEYLIQDYIQKEYELNIIGLSTDHGSHVFIPAVVRKIRDTVTRQSDYIRLDDVAEYPQLNQLDIGGFINEIGYEGLFSIEVIYREGKFYFLEVNLRTDGCNWLYTAGGINYSLLWYLFGANQLNMEVINQLNLKTPLYLMQEPDIHNVFEGRISFGNWFRDLLRTRAFFNPYMKDPLCFSYEMLIHARQAGKLILRKLFRINIH